MEFVCPGGTLFGALASQSNAPVADVVLGLDEITGPQAVADDLLAPLAPSGPGDLVPGVSGVLGGAGYLLPYEYGYLSIDYQGVFEAGDRAATANWSFPATAANASLASDLLIEDPTSDITGEEFLLWEIAFYAQVLHRPWTDFWTAADPHLAVTDSWDDGWTEFTTAANPPPLFVSYSTDPASEEYYGGPPIGTTIGEWNGTSYGWETVYGVGVVRGCAHPTLAGEFAEWIDSGTVQSEIPLTEWEYPANATVPLPSVYDAALPTAGVVALDADGASPYVADGNLSSELSTWQTIASAEG